MKTVTKPVAKRGRPRKVVLGPVAETPRRVKEEVTQTSYFSKEGQLRIDALEQRVVKLEKKLK